jgi:hypothetical protein
MIQRARIPASRQGPSTRWPSRRRRVQRGRLEWRGRARITAGGRTHTNPLTAPPTSADATASIEHLRCLLTYRATADGLVRRFDAVRAPPKGPARRSPLSVADHVRNLSGVTRQGHGAYRVATFHDKDSPDGRTTRRHNEARDRDAVHGRGGPVTSRGQRRGQGVGRYSAAKNQCCCCRRHSCALAALTARPAAQALCPVR